MKKKIFPKDNIIDNKEASYKQKFLYSNLEKNFLKRFFLKILVSKVFTYLISIYLKSFFSKIHIKKVVKTNNINLTLFEKPTFRSYNDFFIRKYKKIFFASQDDVFISPGEGQMSIYPIYAKSIYMIKHNQYHLSDLLRNNDLASKYHNGYLVILRLKPINYHRYIFIDDGIQKNRAYKIKGKFHTVNPIAFKYFNVWQENSREYSILETKNFKKIIQVEIGALLVGKINNHPLVHFRKGQEKGFFSFGGSTIILLVKPNTVIFHQNILNNTQNNIETKVNIGEAIGMKINSKKNK